MVDSILFDTLALVNIPRTAMGTVGEIRDPNNKQYKINGYAEQITNTIKQSGNNDGGENASTNCK